MRDAPWLHQALPELALPASAALGVWTVPFAGAAPVSLDGPVQNAAMEAVRGACARVQRASAADGVREGARVLRRAAGELARARAALPDLEQPLLALERVCLAAAQQLMVARGLAGGEAPLALLARLCAGAADAFEAATDGLRAAGAADAALVASADAARVLLRALARRLRASVERDAGRWAAAIAQAAAAGKLLATFDGGALGPALFAAAGSVWQRAHESEAACARVLCREFGEESVQRYYSSVGGAAEGGGGGPDDDHGADEDEPRPLFVARAIEPAEGEDDAQRLAEAEAELEEDTTPVFAAPPAPLPPPAPAPAPAPPQPPAAAPPPADDELPWATIPRDAVTMDDPPVLLGRGGFGVVYRSAEGGFRGQTVAVKVVVLASAEDERDVRREVELLSGVAHPNVVRAFGAAPWGAQQVGMVLEYMAGGDLCAALRGGALASWARRRAVVRDVAAGVAHLHSLRPPLVLRDLKPGNVLLDAAGAAKLSDFGLARQRSRASGVATRLAGTYSHIAPEAFRARARVHEAVDIYAFGMLLFEVATGEAPWAGLEPYQITVAVAVDRQRPLIPSAVPSDVAELIRECWADAPEDRPVASEVLARLS